MSKTIEKRTSGGSTFYRVADEDEITRPDHITMQQWRRLISAFDSVPVERREQFCEAVGQLAKGYSVPSCGGCSRCDTCRIGLCRA